nr:hypothetical protein Itr_chr04CG17900 [Ipomoea trifida]
MKQTNLYARTTIRRVHSFCVVCIYNIYANCNEKEYVHQRNIYRRKFAKKQHNGVCIFW